MKIKASVSTLCYLFCILSGQFTLRDDKLRSWPSDCSCSTELLVPHVVSHPPTPASIPPYFLSYLLHTDPHLIHAKSRKQIFVSSFYLFIY